MDQIDELAIELAKSFKTVKLPPKLKYKVSKWLKTISGNMPDKQADRRRLMETAKNELINGILSRMDVQPLAKNEFMASRYDNGAIRFDFGSEVPDEVKKAAMKWAKKRGLSPIEAQLQKSRMDYTDYVICGSNPSTENRQEILRLTV